MLRLWDEATYFAAVGLAFIIFWLGWNKFLSNKISGKNCGRFIAYLYISLAILGITLPNSYAQEKQNAPEPQQAQKAQPTPAKQQAGQKPDVNEAWKDTPEWKEFKNKWQEYQKNTNLFNKEKVLGLLAPLQTLAKDKRFDLEVLDLLTKEIVRYDEEWRSHLTRMISPRSWTAYSFRRSKGNFDRSTIKENQKEALSKFVATYRPDKALLDIPANSYFCAPLLDAELFFQEENAAIKHFQEKGLISEEAANEIRKALDAFQPTAIKTKLIVVAARLPLEEHPGWIKFAAVWKAIDACDEKTDEKALAQLKNQLSDSLHYWYNLRGQGYLSQETVNYLDGMARDRMNALLKDENTNKLYVANLQRYEKQIDEIIKLKAEGKVNPQALDKAQNLAVQSLIKTLLDKRIIEGFGQNPLNDIDPVNEDNIIELAQKRLDLLLKDKIITKETHINVGHCIGDLRKALPELLDTVRKLRE